jgi:hypothetical protein
MVKERDESSDDITALLLEAIRKVKHQKQRPNLERICTAVNQVKPLKSDYILQHLEEAVKTGAIIKCTDKHGISSYRDPERAKNLKSRKLRIDQNADLTKVISKSINELGETGGSTLKTIEKFIRTSYNIDFENSVDFSSHLRLCAKRAANLGKIIQEGRHFRTVLTNGYESAGTGSTMSESISDWTYKVIVEKNDKHKV